MNRSDLFSNISAESYQKMLTCFKSDIKTYKTGETICFYNLKNKKVGIVENGKAVVTNTFITGSQTILEYLTEGSIFGEIFYFNTNTEGISVTAVDNCKIRFIDYDHITHSCHNACQHHMQLIENLLSLTSQKASELSEHLDILSQRTIRDKLMAYFIIQCSKNKSRSFNMPFTFSSLADYISADRSAMMREIKKMKDDGVIKTDNKKITVV